MQHIRLSRLAGIGLVAGALLLAGCGASASAAGSSLTITAGDDMHYHPDTISVKAGQAVTIAFKNGANGVNHDFVTQGADKNVRLINLTPGAQQSGTFLATKPGTYQFFCTQPGHKELGMQGTIVVS